MTTIYDLSDEDFSVQARDHLKLLYAVSIAGGECLISLHERRPQAEQNRVDAELADTKEALRIWEAEHPAFQAAALEEAST